MYQVLFAAAMVAGATIAQSPLTTTFAHNNGGMVGGCVYFDLVVNVPIVITGIDLNLNGSGSVDVYTVANTRVGNQLNQAAWTQVASGTVAGAVSGAPSPLGGLAPTTLAPGSYGVALVGVGVAHSYTNGNGSNQTYSTSELTLNGGEASNSPFSGGLFSPRIVNCNIYYTLGGGGGRVLAVRTNYGSGCIGCAESFYENFSSGATFDLNGTSLLGSPNASGYHVQTGSAYVAPGGGATVLPLTDDSEATILLGNPFPLACGAGMATSLVVCSNGFVSVASGNGVAFTPTVAAMLNAPQTAWWCWHDFNPSAAGSGQVKHEVVGSADVITWDGVFDFGSTSANTWQMVFHSSGEVEWRFQQMSSGGNAMLVGYSPGGASSDPGALDLSAALPSGFPVCCQSALPLALDASARPLVGSQVTMTTTNIPAGAMLGTLLVGLTQYNPGLPYPGLSVGCVLHHDDLARHPYIPVGTSMTHALGFLNPVANYPGVTVQLQAAVLTAGGLALTSNGVSLTIGDF
ncbi:MAG: hypothetical protein JNK49_06535 [Planctomycetes bacterium]|nr:hypothetical protein [Planctomycetota bacterium]